MKVQKIDKHTWVFDVVYNEDAADALGEALDDMAQGHVLAAEHHLTMLVDEHPEYVDAWTHLGLVYQSTGRILEAYLCCREACRIGLSVLAEEKFNWEKDSLDWGFIENRQFLRAYFNLALVLIEKNRNTEAQEIFIRLIKISPNDNIGVRYELLEQFLEKQSFTELQWLFDLYPEDYSPEFLYGKILFELQRQNIVAAQNALAVANEAFPLVAKELKKKRHPKPAELVAGYVTVGGKDQAYAYWQDYRQYWKEGSQAYTFLLENL